MGACEGVGVRVSEKHKETWIPGKETMKQSETKFHNLTQLEIQNLKK